VLHPLKLVLDGWPTDEDGNPVVDWFELPNNPGDEQAGTRKVPFTGTLWIEQDDFREDPPRKYFRLSPGREVRLRGAYLVTATDVVRTSRAMSSRCTPPTTPTPAAAMHRTAAR